MKKITRYAFLALGVFWLGVAAAGAVMKGQGGDGWDALVYNVFILIGSAGAVSSLLMFFCLLAAGRDGQRGLKKAALGAAEACNLAFYMFVALLFPVNRDWVSVFFALWLVCAILSLGLLTALAVKKRTNL